MKPASFDYQAPARVTEILGLLKGHGPDARLLAGGQSLLPVLNFRLSRPSIVIDLNRAHGLDYIREEDGHLAIGAMTRERTIETSDPVARRVPLLREATRLIGHLPIRSRGTIGGSLANADPAAEYPAVALALDFTMMMRSEGGERAVAAEEFFQGLLTTALEPDELLTEIHVPFAPDGCGWAFEEIARRHGDFALAGVAAQVAVADGRVTEARLAACGVGPGPVRLGEAERIVTADGLTEKAIGAAADAAAAAVEPSTDVHASADYRRRLTRAMARRALEQAAQRASGDGR